MDRATRKDLLETIEKQKDQIARYEKRLRDVVYAYKSLCTEKEALEASVQILSQKQRQETINVVRENEDENKGSEDDDNKCDDPLQADAQASSASSENKNTNSLQLSTITNALATVSAEKSKMEQNFQADKKKMRQEYEDLKSLQEEEKAQFEELVSKLQEQLTECKSKLRGHQLDLEQEHTTHAMILHELQQLLANERSEKERFEQEIEELQETLHCQQAVPDKSEEYERRITALSDQLDAVRTRLKASEDQAAKPSPLLLELQKEMAEMKAQHRMQVQLEQKKAEEAEEKLKLAAETDEKRVASLEDKLSELSEVTGTYERLRYQDQMAIQRLKERVTQLDLENTALARAANKTMPVLEDAPTNDDNILDVNSLVEKITKLKGLLKLANQNSEKPVDIDEVCSIDDSSSLESNPQHKACQQELKQLKDEFERYKLRAQNVLKSKNAKDNTNSKEMETLKSEVTELRERLSMLRSQLDEDERLHNIKIKEYETTISTLQNKSKEDLLMAELEYKHKVGELEEQVHKQRDRTLALLEEKDKEIETMKHQISQTYGAYTGEWGSRRSSVGQHSDSSDEESQTETTEETHVSDLLSKSCLTMTSTRSESSLLHYAEQQARKDIEINSLRKQKHELEIALRQIQEKCVMNEDKFSTELEDTREEVHRLERSRSRESANLEYLKNVCYSYFMTDDYPSKQQMLNAIVTILHFSPKEKDVVNKKKRATWSAYFQSTAKK